ncbi:MDR family MFS transporter [Nosocomiicoccus ampullae]|uniref:Quinolone resistance protein NorB n=1 Tax=Nosocomiicoccus ampullae TaxID=489910 RepID=A0A9Q2D080_9STAP|nr:MDR family MFS transporter [Nosocomiicoccus ampullae]MBB5176523.1 EmrB/QacA subfamily drug resistance transporter [Nosocomiicoccus ampullae]QYA46560.1 DHA2 family efflux MFS transporter permease subunit [Nosocomiicoccus ampullae]
MEKPTEKPDYRLIIILISGAFIAFLSNTFLNVALPSIKNDFNISTGSVQWVSTSYMLVAGIIIPMTAYFMNRFSAKKIFLSAMGLFLIGTTISGLSFAFPMLIAGRMIQATGASILMPLLMNTMIRSFPPEKRGTAMGLFSLVMFFAPAIGPTLSGIIIQKHDWHVLFLMMIPLLIIILVSGYILLPDVTIQKKAVMDIPSVIMSTIGFGALLYGLVSAGNNKLLAIETFVPILIGVIVIYFYVIRQMKLEVPMLNFRVYKYRMYLLGTLISMATNMGLFAGMILIPIFLQDIQNRTPLETGLLMLPGALILGFLSPVSGKLFDMYGPKVMAITGLALATVTTAFLGRLTIDTSFTYILTIYVIRAFGMTLVNTPVMTNGMNDLPRDLTPDGSSLNSMQNQVSGAVGIALLISVMQGYVNFKLRTIDYVTPEIENEIMIQGINLAFNVGAVFMGLGLITAFFLKRVSSDDTLDSKSFSARPVGEARKINRKED